MAIRIVLKRVSGSGHFRTGAERGATLIEVIVGCGVFAFLMLASIAVLHLGTSGWRTIESKSEVSRALNQFEGDIVTELKRASLGSVGVYTPGSDYRWALWFKTAMNQNDAAHVDQKDGTPLVLGDPLAPIVYNGLPRWQRYVLYYVTRMDEGLHAATYGGSCASYGTSTGPDTICPHKWLVKKEIYLTDPGTGADLIGPQGGASTASNLARYIHDATVTDAALTGRNDVTVYRARVMAKNILSFEVTRLDAQGQVRASGPIILFDVKAFKVINSTDKISVGQSSAVTVPQTSVDGMDMVSAQGTSGYGMSGLHMASAIASQYAPFSVQLDNRIIPGNP